MGNVINLRGLMLAVPLVIVVIFLGWWFGRRAKQRPAKPGMQLRYAVPGKTAPACRAALDARSGDDLFTYTLESAASGGWYLHFTGHAPTGQPLDTLYLLQFEGDDPAILALYFKREAFGMREPVIGEALLDAFFAAKLGARRLPAEAAEPPATPEKADENSPTPGGD